MKRYDNLFSRICSLENLELAERKARRGKRYNAGMRAFDRDPAGNLEKLRALLLSGRYRTSPYTHFTIYEPKEREISRLPYYPDRIVHHAIMNVMEPIWTRQFISSTYACIKGRGIHKAVRDIQRDLRRDAAGTEYCLKIDIRHFYPNVDHEVLKAILRRKIKDARLLALLDGIVDSEEGLPIGNYLSQYFANIYLSGFDHWMKERVGAGHYYRYVDDIVVLSGSKAFLRDCFSEMRDYLSARLRLEVKDNWQVFPVESRGLDFLGYVFRHRFCLLRKRVKRHLIARAARLARLGVSGRNLRTALGSWFGWLKYCDSANLKNHLNSIVNEKVFVF